MTVALDVQGSGPGVDSEEKAGPTPAERVSMKADLKRVTQAPDRFGCFNSTYRVIRRSQMRHSIAILNDRYWW